MRNGIDEDHYKAIFYYDNIIKEFWQKYRIYLFNKIDKDILKNDIRPGSNSEEHYSNIEKK